MELVEGFLHLKLQQDQELDCDRDFDKNQDQYWEEDQIL